MKGKVFKTKTHFLSSHSLLPLASLHCTRYTCLPEGHHGTMASIISGTRFPVLMNSRLLPLSLPPRLAVLFPFWKVVSSVRQDVSLSFRNRVVPVVSDDSLHNLFHPSTPPYHLPSAQSRPGSSAQHYSQSPFSPLDCMRKYNKLTSATLKTTLPTIPFSFLPHPPSPSFF